MAGQLRTIVYSRVSTDAQERDGTFLDTQERASQEYVEANGWTLVGSIRDTASGASLDRPGIERLRFLLRQGSVDMIVTYAVDRLSRNQKHIGVLFDEVGRRVLSSSSSLKSLRTQPLAGSFLPHALSSER